MGTLAKTCEVPRPKEGFRLSDGGVFGYVGFVSLFG